MHLVWDTFEVNQPPFILIRELKLKTRIKSAKFDLRVVSARGLHSYLLHLCQGPLSIRRTQLSLFQP